MGSVSYTELRQNLARIMDEVADNHTSVLVTRSGNKKDVVIMSQTEFDGWQETVHLMSSPANVRRLRRSIAAAERGEAEERAIIGAEPAA